MNTLRELQQLGREGGIGATRCSSQRHRRRSSLPRPAVSRAPPCFTPSQATTEQRQLESRQSALAPVLPERKPRQRTSKGKGTWGEHEPLRQPPGSFWLMGRGCLDGQTGLSRGDHTAPAVGGHPGSGLRTGVSPGRGVPCPASAAPAPAHTHQRWRAGVHSCGRT